MAQRKGIKVVLQDYDSAPRKEAQENEKTVSQPNPQSPTIEYTRINQAILKQKLQVPRTNGCTYYIKDEQQLTLARIKCFNGIDKQDVIRASLDYFFNAFMSEDGVCLSQQGVQEIEKYLMPNTKAE